MHGIRGYFWLDCRVAHRLTIWSIIKENEHSETRGAQQSTYPVRNFDLTAIDLFIQHAR